MWVGRRGREGSDIRKRTFVLTVVRGELTLGCVKNPLGVLSWRQIVVTTVALPLVISLAVLAYAWPAARIAPRDLPVGVVSTGAAARGAVDALDRAAPGAFDVHRYPDQAAARSAIEHRDVYGAFVVAPGGVTVLEATAAGPSVAQLLDASGSRLAAHAAPPQGRTPTASGSVSGTASGAASGTAAAAPAHLRTVDVVPLSAGDARGVVFSSALLPLTICSILIALVVTMSGTVMPGWPRLVGLLTGCAAAAFAVYLVAQGFLGALPHEHAATWGPWRSPCSPSPPRPRAWSPSSAARGSAWAPC